MVNILVFGDSVTHGAWDPEGGWVQRLRKFLDQKTVTRPEFWNEDFFQVYNLGVSTVKGENSGRLLKRLDAELRARSEHDETNIVILSIGKNDSCFIGETSNFSVPLEQFRENILRIIDIALTYTSALIFVSTAPIDESKTNPVKWEINLHYKNEYLIKFNEAAQSVCNEKGLLFIDIYSPLSKLDYKSLLADGLHPNSKGHELIFQEVIKSLEKNKLI